MSAGANDPHSDIQALCDALACAMSVIERQGLDSPSEWRAAIDGRVEMLNGQHEQEIIGAGIEIMGRSRTMH
jgi:hypothetical protein